jgi:hypothetical protein
VLFLIEYARDRGQLVSMKQFEDSEQRAADEARLKLELRLNTEHVEHEVVLLEASSEAALRRTHRRYFENLSELTNRAAS